MTDAERTLLEEMRYLADIVADENMRSNMLEAAELLEDLFLQTPLDAEDLPNENF